MICERCEAEFEPETPYEEECQPCANREAHPNWCVCADCNDCGLPIADNN